MKNTNQVKKVCFFMVIPLTHGAGAEKYFINMAKQLQQKNNSFKVELVTLDKLSYRFISFLLSFYYLRPKPAIERESEEDVRASLGQSVQWFSGSPFKVANMLRHYDYIYTKNEILDLLYLKLFVGYKHLKRIIVGVHTPIKFFYSHTIQSRIHNFIYTGFVYKFLLNGCYLVHSSNRFTDRFVTENFGVPSFYVPYPFDVTSVRDSSDMYKFGHIFEASKVNLAFIARLEEQKGIDILVKLIKKLENYYSVHSEPAYFTINVFGNGNTAIESELKELSIKNSWLSFFGHVENKFVPNILSSQDYLLCPSRWDVMPYNILESLSLGVPVIALDTPGAADLLNEESGILFKSPEDYLEYTKDLIIKNKLFKKALGKKFDYVKTAHSSDAVLTKFSEIYEQF